MTARRDRLLAEAEMTFADPDTRAIAQHIARTTRDTSGDELDLAKRHIALGFEHAANAIEADASDPVVLSMLRLDPESGLRRIAASLRKAAPR